MTDDRMLGEHQRTYQGFVRGSAISIVVIAVVLLLMAAFLL